MTSYPPGGAALHVAGVGDAKVGTGVESSILHAFNVGFAASSANTKIYIGPFTGVPSSTGTLIANIDCSSSTGRQFVFDIRAPGGIYMTCTGNATSDVTLTYF